MARELIVLACALGCSTPTPVPQNVDDKLPSGTGDTAQVFRVDVTPPASCARGASCEARIVLTALGEYHVNDEYPFKFVADAAPGIVVDGPGTFAIGDARRTGTLTVRFRADAAGTARVTGQFKLSVCTDDVCKIESPKVAFDVPVT